MSPSAVGRMNTVKEQWQGDAALRNDEFLAEDTHLSHNFDHCQIFL